MKGKFLSFLVQYMVQVGVSQVFLYLKSHQAQFQSFFLMMPSVTRHRHSSISRAKGRKVICCRAKDMSRFRSALELPSSCSGVRRPRRRR